MHRKTWSIYIIKCRDGKLYTGISNNIEQRVKAHNKGKGCRFTKYRYPVKLVYTEPCGSKSNARKKELEIQRFTRAKKIKLISEKQISRCFSNEGPSAMTNAPMGCIGNIASGSKFAKQILAPSSSPA